MNNSMAVSEKSESVYTLNSDEELRFAVPANECVKITVLEGDAEIFGTDLANDQEYTLRDSNFAVFTCRGCKILCNGICHTVSLATKTPMESYVKAHASLEELRDKAAELNPEYEKRETCRQQPIKPKYSLQAALDKVDSDHAILDGKVKPKEEEMTEDEEKIEIDLASYGPRAMVVGPASSGKSTLCRMLLSYGVRAGREPLFVDLDVAQNEISMPGTMAAAGVKTVINPEIGLDARRPLVRFFGSDTPTSDFSLYEENMDRMATDIFKKLSNDTQARVSGFLMNLCNLPDDMDYDHILHVAKSFKVNVILVLGNGRLSTLLKKAKALSKAKVAVISLDASTGVVVRSKEQKEDHVMNLMRKYYYGARGANSSLSPHEKLINFGDVKLLRVGGNARRGPRKDARKDVKKDVKKDAKKDARKDVKKDAKRGGKRDSKKGSRKDSKKGAKKDTKEDAKKNGKNEEQKDERKDANKDAENPKELAFSRPGKDLINCILGIAFIKDPEDPKDLAEARCPRVAGFLHVKHVNMKKKTMTCLAGCPGPVPSKFLVKNTIKWVGVNS